ncbi:MAG: GAP family protein [Chloroflexi bacterium]|nr:GAP family protein [Chloroflexota bacterium]
MSSVFTELLPLILGAVLAPAWVIIVLLLLASPGGLAKGAGFVVGMTLTRIVQGVVFGTLLTSSPEAKAETTGHSPIVATLLLVIGILLLISAVRKWRKEDDPEDAPPKWMATIEQASPMKALGLGALLVAIGPKLWVFTLSALAIITAAELGLATSVATYLAYIILAQIALILAVLVCAIAPQAGGALLRGAIGWLMRYNRPISIVVALVFGLYFSWQGAYKLLT